MYIEINQTWNQLTVKKGNKSIVLDTIKNNSMISRADIANVTGLNKGTVSSLVTELLEEQLICESGPGESSGGRRPVMLYFNHNAGYSIGIDLGVNYVLGILTDLQGNIFTETKVTFQQLTYEEIEGKMREVIDLLISIVPECPYGVVGIGLGVPGTVSNEGEILLAPNLNWKNVHMQSILEKAYNIPVTVENEANAGAYGEMTFGAGKIYNNLIYVSAGIGIGTGIILSRSIYKGTNGFSGEMGHMTIQANGLKCRCGNEGCWELYASEQALLREAEKSDFCLPQSGTITLDNLLFFAESGNEDAAKLFAKIGKYLGIGLNNIINTFNPEQIILGNRLSTARKWIEKSMMDQVAQHTLWFQHTELDITFSKLSTHSTALGAAAIASERFLDVDIDKKAQEI